MSEPQTRALARRIANLERRSLQTKQPGLGFSSIDDGAIMATDVDQNLKMVIGNQFDGTVTTAVVSGPVPPVPSIPIVQSALEGAVIRWDGEFVDSIVAPMDFARVEVHASTDPDFTAEFAETLLATFESPRGSEVYVNLAPGDYYVKFVTRSEAGVRSDPSEAAEVAPQPIGDLIPVAPTDPPSASPVITATGTVDAIVVEATNITPDETIRYYISATSGFTPGPSTLYATTNSTVLVITSMPDGTPLQGIRPGLNPGDDPLSPVPYYIVAISENAVGDAPPSDEISVTLNAAVVSTLVAVKLVAGFILTGRIQIGQMYIDADDGIVIPQPGGGAIRFPVNGTAATFSGILTAIQQLTVSGSATFNNSVLVQAAMRLGSGVSDPTEPPAVAHDWNNYQQKTGSPPVDTPENFWFGLCTNSAGDELVYASSFFGCDVRRVSKATGEFIDQVNLSTTFYADGGITRIGTHYYILSNEIASGNWRIRKYDSSFNFVGMSFFAILGSTFPKRPAIGTDGTNVLIAFASGATNLTVFTYDPDTLDLVSSDVFAHGGSASFDVAGVYIGNGGTASSKIWVQSITGPMLCYLTSTKARQNSQEFARAGNCAPRGMWWDGTRFLNIDDTAKFWEYGTNLTTHDIDAAWTANDTNATGGTHWTGPSPRTTFSWPLRTRLVVETPPAPQIHLTGTGNDIADRTTVYASDTDGGTLRLQGGGSLAVGVRSLTLEAIATATATPGTNNFGGIGGLGIIQSTGLIGGVPGIELYGDASGRVGPFKWTSAGLIVATDEFTPIQAWTNLTITAPWAAIGSQQPMYKRDAAGNVHIRGALTRNTGTSGNTVATLPAGFRPQVAVFGIIRGASANAPQQIQVTTAGEVVVTYAGTAPATVGIDFIFSSTP